MKKEPRSVEAPRPRGSRRILYATAGCAVAIASLTTGLELSSSRAAASSGVAPNSVGLLDCNHLSPIQKSVAPSLRCADPHGPGGNGTAWGSNGRFEDNGVYIGHDEPSVTFMSTAKGSGNNVSLTETLGTDPSAPPTVNTPSSDSNIYAPSCIGANPCNAYPGAGAAFTELQFYPPGFTPFADAISCDNTHWCAALTIDSLECTFGFANCNGNCVEPINFAWIQMNGVPTGPPSPQLASLKTLSPNAHTLLMSPGDSITAQLFDAPVPGGGGNAIMAQITDNTTHKSGFMQGSAANGFMHTSIVDCSGTPFNYEPEYETAKRGNTAAWTALFGDINTEFEIGHFEPCSSISGSGVFTLNGSKDPYALRCSGPYESAAPGGDGNAGRPEKNDSPCFAAGDTHSGLVKSWAPDEVTGCIDTFAQNGDLDFDGTPYWPDWPDSTIPDNHPSPFLESAPTTNGGSAYAQFAFQTDVALSESTCTPSSVSGCAVPPPNAPGAFYPYWTLTSSCQWEFGNMTNGNNFGGKAKEYGIAQIARLAYPEFISAVRSNSCGA